MLFLVGRCLPDCFARQALQQKRNDKPQKDLASQFLTGSGSTALFFGFIDERIERALLCSLVSMFLFFLQRECCLPDCVARQALQQLILYPKLKVHRTFLFVNKDTKIKTEVQSTVLFINSKIESYVVARTFSFQSILQRECYLPDCVARQVLQQLIYLYDYKVRSTVLFVKDQG